MRQKRINKRKLIVFSVSVMMLALFCVSSPSYALENVEEMTTASDGTRVPVGILKGYEASDETGKQLDPIMYYGHVPDVEKATGLEVEKAWWYQIRNQYAENASAVSGGKLGGYDVGALIRKTNKRGLSRISATRRAVVQWPKKNGIDHQDLVKFMSPEDMRGLATVVCRYTDFNRAYDQSLWVPALRKVRKLGAQDREDSFGGMDIDYDDMVLRTPFDDSYEIIRVEAIDDAFIAEQREVMADAEKDREFITGYFKDEALGHNMWVVESVPKEPRLTYAKRIIWFEQNIWRQVKCQWLDEKGRVVRIAYRNYAAHPFYGTDRRHNFENVQYVRNTLTGHHTEMNVLDVAFNNPTVTPEMFSVRALMRSRW